MDSPMDKIHAGTDAVQSTQASGRQTRGGSPPPLTPTKHMKSHLPGYISGGPRHAQLEAQGLLHLSNRELEQIGDHLRGLTGSKLLSDHFGRHPALPAARTDAADRA